MVRDREVGIVDRDVVGAREVARDVATAEDGWERGVDEVWLRSDDCVVVVEVRGKVEEEVYFGVDERMVEVEEYVVEELE